VVSFTPRPLYSRYLLDKDVWWAPQPVWTVWRKFFTLPALELRPLGRSARSQSLYRLRHPGSLTIIGGLHRKIHREKGDLISPLLFLQRRQSGLICKTIILPLALCGCKILSLTLKYKSTDIPVLNC
jgi:hypothetical protein